VIKPLLRETAAATAQNAGLLRIRCRQCPKHIHFSQGFCGVNRNLGGRWESLSGAKRRAAPVVFFFCNERPRRAHPLKECARRGDQYSLAEDWLIGTLRWGFDSWMLRLTPMRPSDPEEW